MTFKYIWNDAFIKKRISEVDLPTFIKEIVLNLTKCPACGYVFENAYHKKSNDSIVFTHSFARGPKPCYAELAELRSAYHVRRACKLATGEIRA